jgi:hypothetical protein
MATQRISKGEWAFWLLMALVAAIVFALILRPEPVWVDLASVERGPMEVTILEEGKTRVKDRYLISSPVAGYIHRVQLNVGDTVIPGELLTFVDPTPASILDARTRAEAEARAAAAQAALQSIQQKVQRPRLMLSSPRMNTSAYSPWKNLALSPPNSYNRRNPQQPGPRQSCVPPGLMKKWPPMNWPPLKPDCRFQPRPLIAKSLPSG